jgi:hypothetical protein
MGRPTKLDQEALADMLRKHHFVIARGQALACGMSERAMRHRLRAGGPWQRLLPGVYLATTGTRTVDQRDQAALLYAGPGSVITGAAALRRHGLRAPQGDIVDVLVPAKRERQSTGFVKIHYTTRMPTMVCSTGPLQFAMEARAVADAARGLTGLPDVRAIVAGPVQQGRCQLVQLAEELDGGPVRGSAFFRMALAEVADGIRSAAEGDFRDLLSRGGLPKPMFNARLFTGDTFIAQPDAWWPDASVAAEVDSREWHLSPDDWERTMSRHTAMAAHDILPLHFTPRQIRTEAATVVHSIRSALDTRRGRTYPAIRALPPLG